MVAGEAVRSGELPGFITKILVPRQRPDILSRPRLTAFVERHVDLKLIAVCAPAGYGKTTLLADFSGAATSAVSGTSSTGVVVRAPRVAAHGAAHSG